MKPPPYNDTQFTPLSTEIAIQERVADLIGRASHRQIWLMFVDDADLQVPVLVPIDGHPSLPGPDDIARLTCGLADVAAIETIAGLITVIERYGSPELTPSDLAWANAINEAANASPMTLRGILLSHARGVRWVAPDDYLFPPGEADV